MFCKYPVVDVSDKTCQNLLRSLTLHYHVNEAWLRLKAFRQAFDVNRNIKAVPMQALLFQECRTCLIATHEIQGFRLNNTSDIAYYGFIANGVYGMQAVVMSGTCIAVDQPELIKRVMDLCEEARKPNMSLVHEFCCER